MLTSVRHTSLPASVRQPEMPNETARIVEWLSDPATHRGQPVEVVETHFAWVFLAGAWAFKLKKATRARGCDLRQLASRERACRQELQVNRRLAAWTYLGVAAVTETGGRLGFDEPGRVVDWVVRMRRLDRRLMLDSVLRSSPGCVDALAKAIVQLRALDPGPLELDDVGYPEARGSEYLIAVHARAAEALGEIARPEHAVPTAERAALARALLGRIGEARGSLAGRAGAVRDGHGDLRAEHVWLGRPVQIIDALEFDASLRRLDPAEDVAMLAVDVETIAGPGARRALCGAYEVLARDSVPPVVWQVYLGLRAATRAKVALWHVADHGRRASADEWRTRALRFAALAIERLESAVYD